MKTQIKTLEFNLKERDNEISSLKKKTKVTKMDECILRLEIAEAEAMRLRNALEETQQRTKELKYTGGDQAVIIEKLKRKNKELSAELAKKREALNKQKEYDNTKYNKPEGASNKQIQEYKNKISKLTDKVNKLQEKLDKGEFNDGEEIDEELSQETIEKLKNKSKKHNELAEKHNKVKERLDTKIIECIL